MSTQLISIITPVYDGGHGFLLDAYRSLISQEMPPGWGWQWIVQEDGETGTPVSILPDDPRISTGSGRRGGAAVARTLGLARATGVLTRPLDADDVLTPGALWRDIATLSSHDDLGWCVSAGLDLLSNGTLAPPPQTEDFPGGRLDPDVIFAFYAAGMHRVISCSMAAHTALVRAVGGWAALPASEDTSLLLACEAVASGWMISEPSMYYRKHPLQSTQRRQFTDPDELAARRASLLGRRHALRQAGWRWAPHDVLTPIPEAS